jgi:hypothetical protein
MVNDGHAISQPVGVKVTVVGPVECEVKIAPSTINLRSNGRHILARIRFPHGFTGAEAGSDEPLLLYPGGVQAARWWTVRGHAHHVSMFACFDKRALSGELQMGRAELTVVGKLRSGQVFYGRDTVRIVENGTAK